MTKILKIYLFDKTWHSQYCFTWAVIPGTSKTKRHTRIFIFSQQANCEKTEIMESQISSAQCDILRPALFPLNCQSCRSEVILFRPWIIQSKTGKGISLSYKNNRFVRVRLRFKLRFWRCLRRPHGPARAGNKKKDLHPGERG